MHFIQPAQSNQQERFNYHARHSDSYHFFNLLPGPELFDKLEEQIPDHRERLFPPTETLSMFLIFPHFPGHPVKHISAHNNNNKITRGQSC